MERPRPSSTREGPRLGLGASPGRPLGRDWTGVAAVVLLTLWVIVEFRATEVGPLPFAVAWGAVLGCFFTAYAIAGLTGVSVGPGRLLIVLIGAVATVAVVARVGFDASWLRVAGLAALVAGAGLGGGVARLVWPRVASSTLVLAVGAVAVWLLLDVLSLQDGIGLYDFQVYLGSAARFAAGENPYLLEPMSELPGSAAFAGFLSPPVLLPVFAGLASLPFPVAAITWVVLLVASAAGGLRLLGLPWRWVAVFLAYPPLLPESGNLANLLFLLLCLGPVVGSGLVAGSVFKVQAAIPALWLVRERRWRDLLIGLLLLVGLVLLTLPFVGLESWSEYARGLQLRAQSQENLPILYGVSLAQWMPWPVLIGVSVVAIALALLLRGSRGLSGLGLATIVASPTLWAHGFAAAIPAVLFLDARVLWLSVGVGAEGFWFWVLPLSGAWALWRARRPSVHDDPLHPLHRRIGPWEDADTGQAGSGQ